MLMVDWEWCRTLGDNKSGAAVVDREHGGARDGRESRDVLAVRGTPSSSLSSESESEWEEGSASESDGRPIIRFCFLDILRSRFGRDGTAPDMSVDCRLEIL